MVIHHPGKTLLDQYMQPKRLSQNKLARLLCVPPRRINEIVLGKRAITADTAIRLATYFGNSASYWMHIQSEYDIDMAKEKLGQRLHMIQSSTEKPDLKKQQSTTHNTNNNHQPKNIKRHMMR